MKRCVSQRSSGLRTLDAPTGSLRAAFGLGFSYLPSLTFAARRAAALLLDSSSEKVQNGKHGAIHTWQDERDSIRQHKTQAMSASLLGDTCSKARTSTDADSGLEARSTGKPRADDDA